MTPLEGRYRRLLLTYPPEYRRDHESEMLGTLLQAASPGQSWPSAREGAALLIGGLRTRARLAEGSPERLWADGVRLGALLLLLRASSELLGVSVALSPLGRVNGSIAKPEIVYLEGLFSLLAAVALLRARYCIGLCAVAGMLALQLITYMSAPPVLSPLSSLPASWVLVGAILTVLASRRSLRATSKAWSWRLALPWLTVLVSAVLAVAGLICAAGSIGGQLLWALGFALEILPAAVAIGIALLARDGRPALAATLYMAVDFVERLQTIAVTSESVVFPRDRYLLESLMILLVGAGITTASILLARRPAAGASYEPKDSALK